MSGAPGSARLRRLLEARWLAGAAALLSIAVMAPSLGAGLMMDDYMHRALFLERPLHPAGGPAVTHMFAFLKGDPELSRTMMDLGTLPWWALPTIEQSFWRPVTGLTHALDYRLWPDTPALMHAHSLLWLGLLILCAGRLYARTLAPAWVAGLATLLFALDDAKAMPAGWIANRNELVSAVFALLALERFIAWRSGRARGAAPAAAALFVAALLAKESALSITPYLFGYVVFVERGPLLRRMLALAPFAAIVLVWRAVYVALGFGTFGMESYADPLSEPVTFLGAVVERLPILLLAQFALPPSDLTIFMSAARTRVLWVLAVLVLALLAWILLPLLRRDAQARFWASGLVLALLPSCSTFMSDRMLVFSGIGAMPLMAMLVREAAAALAAGCGGRPERALIAAIVAIQLVLPVPSTQVRIAGIAAYSRPVESAVAALDDVPHVEGKTVVLVNAPNSLQATYVPQIRQARGLPTPRHTYTLGPDTGLPVSIRYRRCGPRSLEVSPSQPFAWSLFRDYAHPFAAGDVVTLAGMEVRVRETTQRGEPTRVEYVFPERLESEQLVWLFYTEGRYARFEVPAAGAVTTLP